MFLCFLIPFFSLQFTISLSLRIFWGITLSSISSTHPFFFCVESQRISRFKCTAFCTLYSVKYSQLFVSTPSTLPTNDLRASSAAQSTIISPLYCYSHQLDKQFILLWNLHICVITSKNLTWLVTSPFNCLFAIYNLNNNSRCSFKDRGS
jgi:hypothetical protein